MTDANDSGMLVDPMHSAADDLMRAMGLPPASHAPIGATAVPLTSVPPSSGETPAERDARLVAETLARIAAGNDPNAPIAPLTVLQGGERSGRFVRVLTANNETTWIDPAHVVRITRPDVPRAQIATFVPFRIVMTDGNWFDVKITDRTLLDALEIADEIRP